MENWKPVIGFEGIYEVSDLGNVRGVDRSVNHSRGGLRKVKGKPKSTMMGNSGYLYTILSKNGKNYHVQIHRMVACAFIENPEEKPQVNHINAIKTDNRKENLEWCTASENMQHAYRENLIPKNKIGRSGSKNPSARAVYRYDPETGNNIERFETMKEAAQKFNISMQSVCNACHKYRGKSSCKGLFFRLA